MPAKLIIHIRWKYWWAYLHRYSIHSIRLL